MGIAPLARLRARFGRTRVIDLPAADEPKRPVGLDDVRRRLELLLAGVYGHPVTVAAAETPRESAFKRLLRHTTPAHLRPAAAPLAANDGARVLLPTTLESADGDVIGRYRILAMEQAERLVRGTALALPADEPPLVRDLYAIAEGAAADRAIAAQAPGLARAHAAARADALARRPALDVLTPAERQVESLVRGTLSADPGAALPELPAGATPADSLAWARQTAARLASAGARYRGVAPVDAWGTVLPVTAAAAAAGAAATPPPAPLRHRPMRKGTSGGKQKLQHTGRGDGQGGDETSSTTDPFDRNSSPGRIADPEGASKMPAGDDAADSAAREPEALGGGALRDTADPSKAANGSDAPDVPVGEPYPEWDAEKGGYWPRRAWIRTAEARLGDPEWAGRVLASHAGTIRRLKKEFERLRARRLRLPRQRDGEELDLAACIRALVDLRTGHTVNDRLYASVRPARRELSILLLMDVSGSTSEPVPGGRIIDVEKIAVLLAAEAFEALGDRYAILSFSGKLASHVRIRVLKDFAERAGDEVRRRVAAMEPEGYTRMGAAIRHGSALLAQQGTAHRLLLIVSDGRPNDEDYYQGRYAIEDTRQAIAEARQQGIFPFCLTVDRAANAYLPRIFGTAGHRVLHRPEHLPIALLGVVRGLLRG